MVQSKELILHGATYIICSEGTVIDPSGKVLKQRKDKDVIHSKESFQKLFQQKADWLEHLKKNNVKENIFTNRIVNINVDTILNWLN